MRNVTHRKLSFSVRNLRAVKDAHIELNGITVVSGVNSTGKSTLSRLLYYMVRQTVDYEIEQKDKMVIYLEQLFFTLKRIAGDFHIDPDEKINIPSIRILAESGKYDIGKLENLAINIVDQIEIAFEKRTIGSTLSSAELKRIYNALNLQSSFSKISGDEPLFNIKRILFEVRQDIQSVKEQIKQDINSRPLSSFYNSLAWKIKTPNIDVDFSEDDVPIIDKEKNRLHNIYTVDNVFYIDTPFALNIAGATLTQMADGSAEHWEHIRQSISKTQPIKLAFEHETAHKAISKIIAGDALIEKGEIREKFLYKRTSDNLTIELAESATGIQSFATLQLLLSHGFLNDKTLLILDEPEAHLHPQWIVEYARIIVLLNKHLGVRFMLASHNPDMVSALRYISEKENVLANTNFYLAEEAGNQQNIFKNLADDIEPIFGSFNIALDRISEYGV